MGKVTTVENSLLDSKAYIELKGTSAKILLWFLKRRKLEKRGRKGKESWIIINSGEIIFSYPEAKKKYKIHKSTFVRALDDLISKGFIEINHHGGGMQKDKTTYFITDKWLLYGTKEFKIKPRPKDTRGLGFKNKHK